MTYLKMLIGIEFLNTKQFSATLSPPSIKLSKFIGGKVPPPKKKKKKEKKERVIYDSSLSLCL